MVDASSNNKFGFVATHCWPRWITNNMDNNWFTFGNEILFVHNIKIRWPPNTDSVQHVISLYMVTHWIVSRLHKINEHENLDEIIGSSMWHKLNIWLLHLLVGGVWKSLLRYINVDNVTRNSLSS